MHIIINFFFCNEQNKICIVFYYIYYTIFSFLVASFYLENKLLLNKDLE